MTIENNRDGVQLIGITGGMGSGKSTVSRFMSEYMHVPCVDIDALCRKLLETEQPGWQALRHHLSPSFFVSDGSLDRRLLRSAIFEDRGLRESVDRLLHPLALIEMKNAVAATRQQTVLVDVPLLFEAGWENNFNRLIVVYADPITCCRRLMARDSISADEAGRSICAQMHPVRKALLADHVINNSGCLFSAMLQAVHLARLLKRDFTEFLFHKKELDM